MSEFLCRGLHKACVASNSQTQHRMACTGPQPHAPKQKTNNDNENTGVPPPHVDACRNVHFQFTCVFQCPFFMLFSMCRFQCPFSMPIFNEPFSMSVFNACFQCVVFQCSVLKHLCFHGLHFNSIEKLRTRTEGLYNIYIYTGQKTAALSWPT